MATNLCDGTSLDLRRAERNCNELLKMKAKAGNFRIPILLYIIYSIGEIELIKIDQLLFNTLVIISEH